MSNIQWDKHPPHTVQVHVRQCSHGGESSLISGQKQSRLLKSGHENNAK